MPTKILSQPTYFLVYTNDEYTEPGQITWYTHSVHTSETDAVAALLLMASSTYTHANIVQAELPALVVPEDLKLIVGTVTNG